MSAGTVIVGAGAAGIRLAADLRCGGYTDPVTVIDQESEHPYDRPPLSKAALGAEFDESTVYLEDPAALERQGVELRQGVRADSLDTGGPAVLLSTGEALSARQVVIATGVHARTLPATTGMGNVGVLRTMNDARRLRIRLSRMEELLIIGAGFIGMEVAASAVARGVRVTVVEPQPRALAGKIPAAAADALVNLHRSRGVEFHFGVLPEGWEQTPNGRVRATLSDSHRLEADFALVGIGTVPNTEWLTGSGLTLENGVVTDAWCTAAENVYAIGDVANTFHPNLGRHQRVEHRSNAAEQGGWLARYLLGQTTEPYTSVPFFWTDQYDRKLQMYGLAGADDDFQVVTGDLAALRFVATFHAAEQLTAVMACNAVKDALPYRRELEASYRATASTALN